MVHQHTFLSMKVKMEAEAEVAKARDIEQRLEEMRAATKVRAGELKRRMGERGGEGQVLHF
jgi:hypothetical protein